MSPSSAPSATSAAAAWITVPKSRGRRRAPGADGRLEQPAQAARGELVDLRRRHPDLARDRLGPDHSVSAYHCRGLGALHPGRGQPGQLAGGRLPDGRGQARVGGRPAQVGGERRQGQPAAAGAATSSIAISSPASSARNRDGRSSLSSPADGGHDQRRAGPGSRRRRTAAVPRRAASSSSATAAASAPAAIGAPGRRAVGQPAGRRVDQLVHPEQRAALPQIGPDSLLHAGHHDQVPFQALGPVRGQDGDRLARAAPAAASVSPAISWPVRLSRKSVGSTRAASARRIGPRRRRAPSRHRGRRRRSHRGCRRPRSRPATGRPGRWRPRRPTAPPAAVPSASALSPRRPGWRPGARQPVPARSVRARPGGQPAVDRAAGPASAAASGPARGVVSARRPAARAGGWPPPGGARRIRRSRRRPSASVPPSGPVSSSAASVLGQRAPVERAADQAQQRAGPGSSASGSSSPATATGTPAPASARCRAGTWRTAERTSTAIDDQGTPSIRCARRSVSAMRAASCARWPR